MKRNSLIAIMILLLAIIVLTACGKTEGAAEASGTPSNLSKDAAIGEGPTATPGDIGQSNDQAGGGNGATIIAQSNNAVTDSEKKKILLELNNEIDSLIDSINALDSIQESDLTFEE